MAKNLVAEGFKNGACTCSVRIYSQTINASIQGIIFLEGVIRIIQSYRVIVNYLN